MKKTLVFSSLTTASLLTPTLLISCKSEEQQVSKKEFDQFVNTNVSLKQIDHNLSNKSAFEASSSDFEVVTEEQNANLKTSLRAVTNLSSINVNSALKSQYADKMIRGEGLFEIKIAFTNPNGEVFNQVVYQLQPRYKDLTSEKPKLQQVANLLKAEYSKDIFDLTNQVSDFKNFNLIDNAFNTKEIRVSDADGFYTDAAILENNLLNGVIKALPFAAINSQTSQYLRAYKQNAHQNDTQLIIGTKYLPTLTSLLGKNYKLTWGLNLKKVPELSDKQLNQIKPSQLSSQQIQKALTLVRVESRKTGLSKQFPQEYLNNLVQTISNRVAYDNQGKLKIQATLTLPLLDNAKYVDEQGIIDYQNEQKSINLEFGGFEGDTTAQENIDFENQDANIVELSNSDNVLNHLQSTFENTSALPFLNLAAGVDLPKLTKQTNFIKNGYIGQFIAIDDAKIKAYLVEKFPKYAKLINKLIFSVRYHDIQVDRSNFNNFIFPIDIIHNLDNQLGLYEFRTINFIIPNVGSDNLTEQQKELTSKFNEFAQLINSDNLKVTTPSLAEVEAIKGSETFEELSKQKLTQIFKLSIQKSIHEKLNQLWDEKKYQYHLFISGFNFDKQLGKMNLKVRFALADQSNEYAKLKEIQKDLSDDQIKKLLSSASKTNLGADFNLVFDYLDSPIYQLLKEEQAASWVDVNVLQTNKFNYDYQNFKINDFTFTNSGHFKTLKLLDAQKIDDKNILFRFKGIDALTFDEIIFTKKYGLGHLSYPLGKEFTNKNSKSYNFIAGSLTRDLLPKVNTQIFSIFGNNIIAGGYDELRGFYASAPKYPYQLHLGEDYLVNSKHPIYAPYDGEIVGIVYSERAGKDKNVAEGIGTTMLMRVKLADIPLSSKDKEKYFLDSEYVYIGYIHVDQEKTFNNTMLNIVPFQKTEGKGDRQNIVTYADYKDPKTGETRHITPDNPLKVKQGDIIGYVGTEGENGGWMPHVHISVVAGGEKNFNDNYYYTTKKDYYPTRWKRKYNPDSEGTWSSIRVPGVAFSYEDYSLNTQNAKLPKLNPTTGEKIKGEENLEKQYSYAIFPIQNQELKDGLRNPNILFKLRGEDTYAFSIERLFALEK